MAGGPALQTAEMRLAGGAGSSFTYFAHLQLCHVCSGCRVSYNKSTEGAVQATISSSCSRL